MRAACGWLTAMGGIWLGNVQGIQKYSFIVQRPQDGACTELVRAVVGRGLYAVYLKPHQSPGPCVMWSGRTEEGSPVDLGEPPLRCSAGTGGQWCNTALGNKQLWLRDGWLCNMVAAVFHHHEGYISMCVCVCVTVLLHWPLFLYISTFWFLLVLFLTLSLVAPLHVAAIRYMQFSLSFSVST